MTARLAVLAVFLLAACAVPEETTTGGGGGSGTSGGGSAAGGGAGGGAAGGGGGTAACACYFSEWSLRTGCGTSCVGDAKLICTSVAALVQDGGCAFDGGTTSADAGTADAGTDDAGLPDAGPTCTPASPSCMCTFKPYGSGSLTLTTQCCTTLCVASQPENAWDCDGHGVVKKIPAVCKVGP